MAEKPFRVLLDLTDLHFESFKYVWIYVSPREIKTIAEFKVSLINKIKLGNEDIKLFLRDGLLLDEETIMILREDDTVKVQLDGLHFPFQANAESSSKEHKKPSRKRGLEQCNQEAAILNSKKHKKCNRYVDSNQHEYEDVNSEIKCKLVSNNLSQNNVETINVAETVGQKSEAIRSKKRGKKSVEADKGNTIADNSQSFESSVFETANFSSKKNYTFEVNPCSELSNFTKSNVTTVNSSLKEQPESSQEKVDTEISGESGLRLKNNCPKKKRKRRKNKKSAEPVVAVEKTHNANLDNGFKSFNDTDNICTNRKHTIYTSPLNSPAEPLCLDKNEIVIFLDDDNDNHHPQVECTESYSLDDISNAGDQSHTGYPKVSTPTQSTGCSKPNWRVTLMPNENLSSHKTTSPKKTFPQRKFGDIDSSPVKCPASDISSQKQNYESFPSLKSVPEIGTHIAYKILELDETYNPVVSEFREGIVKYVNPTTEEMEIEFLKHEIKPGRTGKFENLKEDEMPPPEIRKAETVVWSTLIEPKLLS